MAISGMEMLMKSMGIDPIALQSAMHQLPQLAELLTNKVNAMDAKLDRILKILDSQNDVIDVEALKLLR